MGGHRRPEPLSAPGQYTVLRKVLAGALLLAAVACGSDAPPGPPTEETPTSLGIAAQPSGTATNGVALTAQPAVRLRSATGSPVRKAGVVVTAVVAAGGVTLTNATALTNVNGVATFAGLTLTGTAGPHLISFTATDLTQVDANPVTLVAGAPAKLGFVTPPPATATSGAVLPAMVVQLLDQSDNPAAQQGVAVTAGLAAGAVTMLNTVASTDANGRATFSSLILSGTAGPYVLRFSASGLTALDAPAALQLGAGAAFGLSIATQPAASAASGVALVTQPVVQLRDAWGNAVAQAGVMVVASAVTAGPTLAGDSVATDATGAAHFTALQLTGLAGSHTLRFTATGLQPAVAQALTLTAGAAKGFTVTTQPSGSAQSGVVLATQPVVQVVDASGNPVSQAGIVVTASVFPLGATVAGNTATSNANGVAQFSGVTLTGQANNAYRLRFAAPGLDTAQAGNVTALAPGPVAQLVAITAPPATATNDIAMAPAPVYQLRDAFGNDVAQLNVVVRATLVSGAGVLSGDSVNTAANGRATFSALKITGLVGSYSLQFTTAGVPAAAPPAITLNPGVATALRVETEPAATAQDGVVLTTQPVVRLLDVSGNLVSQLNVVVVASTIGSTATVSGGTVLTNASGIATFTNLALSGPIGPHTLRFTANTFHVDAAAPTTIGP